MFAFNVSQTDRKARRGAIVTSHGQVETPIFMPVGTAGSVKGITPDQLAAGGSQMILANTYHLMLRPGAETVERLGGLHSLMGWRGPILTDSGGYQVFSLAHMRKINDDGVRFQSHIDGAEVYLTPERAVEIQRLLGADVMMQLDECPPAIATRNEVATAVRRSLAWANRCKEAWISSNPNRQVLFGIQQGGLFADLRGQSAEQLVELDLPGYAIGGLSVGEARDGMYAILDDIDELFPKDKPRYLMGVGEPRDILEGVLRGVDMFDCVLPTRNGRNAQAFTWGGRVRLRNAACAIDTQPIDEHCPCYACRNFSRGTIRHLFQADEMLGPILVTIHNLHFFADFLAAIRQAITDGDLASKAIKWTMEMYPDVNGEEV